MKIGQFRVMVAGALGALLSMPAAAQGSTASDQQAPVTPRLMELTLVPVARYPDETYVLPYACYRLRRCSAYDLYRFRDRPNRLTRLAPESPAESDELAPPIDYLWFFVQVTPEENILPEFRSAGQVREEHRNVGRPVDDPD
jgi:hypothetical protein